MPRRVSRGRGCHSLLGNKTGERLPGSWHIPTQALGDCAPGLTKVCRDRPLSAQDNPTQGTQTHPNLLCLHTNKRLTGVALGVSWPQADQGSDPPLLPAAATAPSPSTRPLQGAVITVRLLMGPVPLPVHPSTLGMAAWEQVAPLGCTGLWGCRLTENQMEAAGQAR